MSLLGITQAPFLITQTIASEYVLEMAWEVDLTQLPYKSLQTGHHSSLWPQLLAQSPQNRYPSLGLSLLPLRTLEETQSKLSYLSILMERAGAQLTR